MVRTKLHEAMQTLLNKEDGMHVSDMVNTINTTRMYTKRDFSLLKSSQIYARVNQYPHLFYIENGRVYKKV